MMNVSVNGNGCFLTQRWHSLINANIKMPLFYWSGSIMGNQANKQHWTVRHEAQTTGQRPDVRPGFESRGNQLCEIGLMTGECVTAVLVWADGGGADCDNRLPQPELDVLNEQKLTKANELTKWCQHGPNRNESGPFSIADTALWSGFVNQQLSRFIGKMEKKLW